MNRTNNIVKNIDYSGTRGCPKHDSSLGLSDRALMTIFNTYLKFHLYKMTVFIELYKHYLQTSIACYKKVLLNAIANTVLHAKDEAYFYLPGNANEQNFRYWRESNHYKLQKGLKHWQWDRVWRVVVNLGVHRPYVSSRKAIWLE